MKILKWISIALIAITTTVVFVVFAVPYILGVPQNRLPDNTQAKILKALRSWDSLKPSYAGHMEQYDNNGDYLGYGRGPCRPNTRNSDDGKGVMQRVIEGERYYHPVLSAQCGLKAYGLYIKGDKNQYKSILAYADNLVALQDQRGAFQYPFPYKYYLSGEILAPGWVSGMAQGQALSFLARAYHVTKDQKYIQAGRKALTFMQVSTKDGGVMTTLNDFSSKYKNEIFFEEYVSTPANYTLNGYMFALLGVYDWSQLDQAITADQSTASDLFKRGMQSLRILLPSYDLGKVSAYDLGYVTFKDKTPHISSGYHAVHIFLLNAIYSITGDEISKDYRDRWILYMNPKAREISEKLAEKNISWPILN
ncbi:D-glucuronyl C5-epimerase family protein [Pseudomonas sp. BBP2017]|uniref:D-glucuronyl C5-epimerase family protein n=1 Tax=Pseudomonas sp. BBP2017 TaxID=2109731 RepID=UPI001305049C|nr:D-glucuronyl C5-epimerase family protein [Pseudomonas sp. BBP2017]